MASPNEIFQSYDRLELIVLKDRRDEAAVNIIKQITLTAVNVVYGENLAQTVILLGAAVVMVAWSGVAAAILPWIAIRIGVYISEPWLRRRDQILHYRSKLEYAAKDVVASSHRFRGIDLSRAPTWLRGEISALNHEVMVAEEGLKLHSQTPSWKYSPLVTSWNQIKKDWDTWRALDAQIRSASVTPAS